MISGLIIIFKSWYYKVVYLFNRYFVFVLLMEFILCCGVEGFFLVIVNGGILGLYLD